MLLMNGYLRKAQHDENNLNIEVTVEVISDFKVKKASVFNGFKRQTTKNTASRLPVALRSSASADFVVNYPGKLRFSGVFLYEKLQYRIYWLIFSLSIRHYILCFVS